jgi:uncharacterized membrane protein SpoIIM required for sporulation
MKVAKLLEQRRRQWHELEELCVAMQGRRLRELRSDQLSRFAALYRGVCADLALADAYQLPPNTVNYLHQLVGRAHNQLYRSQTFRLSTWGHELFVSLPRKLYQDNYIRVAFVLFWGFFLAAMCLGYSSQTFTEKAIGGEQIEKMEEMYDEAHWGRNPNVDLFMVAFYIQNNTSIGLWCFACGLFLGVGGLLVVIDNAVQLGTIFGHMATTEQRETFFQFVTAHGPFELTAIVISAAAGMRLGFAIVDTQGYTRTESIKRAARDAMPTMCLGMVLFLLAALIEGIVSPSALPYWVKATVAVVTSGMLVFYFVVLGQTKREGDLGAG